MGKNAHTHAKKPAHLIELQAFDRVSSSCGRLAFMGCADRPSLRKKRLDSKEIKLGVYTITVGMASYQCHRCFDHSSASRLPMKSILLAFSHTTVEYSHDEDKVVQCICETARQDSDQV